MRARMSRDRHALRVVCYAVNGTGVGHVTRLLSIARWLRRYGDALDRKIEIWFLTSSEADSLVFAEGFAAFKIPSKTIVAETGIDRTAYLALAKQWIWHTLGLLRPDLLIVDTFPRGSFGELLGALDLCRHKAFVYRPVREAVAARPDFQAMLPLYDLIVVPEIDVKVLTPASAARRVVHTGPVISRERWELKPREVARAELGVADHQKCVFVSAGGGGAKEAEAQLVNTVAELIAVPELAVVVGAGPLYRGAPFRNVVNLGNRAADWALGFDVAVAASGYNTFAELMSAGVPTVFLPQSKIADDQEARATRAAESGAGAFIARYTEILPVMRSLLENAKAPTAARSLMPVNGARNAAAELLRLLVPPQDVDRVEAALDDETLAKVPRDTERTVLGLAHKLARGREDELGYAIAHANALLETVTSSKATASLPTKDTVRELRGLLDAIANGMLTSDVEHRNSVCYAAIAEIGALSAGDGAAAKLAASARRWPAEATHSAKEAGVALAQAIRASFAEDQSSSADGFPG
jgi:UDP-N-acetylglucosamine--N-acetylmuramyl-(pentapeptide) pyrophosphoryl-undecaprenol N-acetylglucosamine transferase